MSEINGKDILALGIRPGPHIKPMLDRCKQAGRVSMDLIEDLVPPPTIPLRDRAADYSTFLEPQGADETANRDSVIKHFEALMRVPTIKRGAIMPDACPAGNAKGTIPVGGVVACENAIHPGFHSADVCCSMAATVISGDVDAGTLLDAAQKISHFGPLQMPRFSHKQREGLGNLIAHMEYQNFLAGLERYAERDFMSQGDGNHFFYVGHIGQSKVIVTHHGSRGLGANLYKRGLKAAQRYTKKVAPEVPKHNAWLKADSEEGESYWQALQIVREWTRMNHFAIHDEVLNYLGLKVEDRFWNEHNFVFQRSDGLFYHGKGATPNYAGFSHDDPGVTLVPMNMGREILILEHRDNKGALGFAPHGAGRNMSRTAHKKMLAGYYGLDDLSDEIIQTVMNDEILSKGVDARFYTGHPDVSELPSAYKSADRVIGEIENSNLGRVIARIEPLGSLMAGEFPNYRQNRKKSK